ncbi:histidine phosphatase family protein [uncultured Corynebacterium sp.]|uniref:histidine phosphatase family protein n=1 Tax=uncultured Corynebacterium sp. TaxID=159447 RepID=UPI0025E725EB|nr:histidine phosphatase family protein [uncultured Corynebacterium sp.]
MKVVLFRHGETEWNGARRLQGQQNLSLSEVGRSQVAAAASLVQRLTPDMVVASPLARASESAVELGYPEFHVEHRLAERCLGTWEGKFARDVVDQEGDNYQHWREGTYDPPGSESIDAFRTRVMEGLQSVLALAAEQEASTLLIATHGGVIRALMDLTVGLDQSRAVPLHPASISVLDIADGGAGTGGKRLGVVKLRLYNWTSEYLAEPATE